MTENEVYTAILTGQYDDGLDRLDSAIRERRRMRSATMINDFEKDDRIVVKLPPGSRPKYLNGATGVVHEKRITKIAVKFDEGLSRQQDPYGKLSGRVWVLPASALVKVQ